MLQEWPEGSRIDHNGPDVMEGPLLAGVPGSVQYCALHSRFADLIKPPPVTGRLPMQRHGLPWPGCEVATSQRILAPLHGRHAALWTQDMQAKKRCFQLSPVRNVSGDTGALARERRWQELLTLLPVSAQSPDTSIVAYNSTIASLGMSKNWKHALLLFSEMPAAEVTPDVVSYNATIRSMSRSSLWQPALSIFASHEGLLACAKCQNLQLPYQLL